MLEAPPAVAQMAAPTVNLIERVLMVQSVVPQGKAGTINVVGTIFSIDIDHREYWLTAKHILTGAKHPPYGSVTEKSVSLSILNPNAQGEQWESVNFSVIDPGTTRERSHCWCGVRNGGLRHGLAGGHVLPGCKVP
jgi:hypothetical protein